MPKAPLENSSIDFNDTSLNAQQRSLRRQGRLNWVHWCILCLSVVFTFLGWHMSNSLLQKSELDRFQREAHRVVDQMRIRMSRYEDSLLAGVATLQSHKNFMTRAQWKDYATSLNMTSRYPGLNGIGLIREVANDDLDSFERTQQRSWPGFNVFPPHNFPTKLPIVFIEPEKDNAAAIGLDVAFEENRRTAAMQARNNNLTRITGPIELVQDTGKTPGFLFYTPLYIDNMGFEGLVYAPLVMKNLVAGVRGNQEHHVIFSISDGDTLLYDETATKPEAANKAVHSIEIEKNFYGRKWAFLIQSAPGFFATSGLTQPTIVLICGLTIEAMLLILFLMLTRANRRVLNLAESMTGQLALQTKVLASKNSELESFAHIVSHDLKTPIRGIQNLTFFIEEDMEEFAAPDELKSVIKNHVKRINEQAERGQALIKGLLNFSLIGHETDSLEKVDTTELLRNIAASFNLSDAQLHIGPNMPTLFTYSIRLTQVFENLISNAYKYHPTPDAANITVTVDRQSRHYRFSVKDDGKGIDKKYHERVFKPFIMLQPYASPDSSGIGLSIVKKTVESMGGNVGIKPSKDVGAVFFFDWPIVHQQSEEEFYRAA
ncbi:MAG: CHASE domain-containing protein [Granulosicoccus sp.]